MYSGLVIISIKVLDVVYTISLRSSDCVLQNHLLDSFNQLMTLTLTTLIKEVACLLQRMDSCKM
jgi:hypothetical protein